MKRLALVVAAVLLLGSAGAAPAADAPGDQLTWAVHTTLVPTYFDPAETTIITAYMVLYALHDGALRGSEAQGLSLTRAAVRATLADTLSQERAR